MSVDSATNSYLIQPSILNLLNLSIQLSHVLGVWCTVLLWLLPGKLEFGWGGTLFEKTYVSYDAGQTLAFEQVLLFSEDTSDWIWTGSSSEWDSLFIHYLQLV